jgi:hypothetical protein
VTDRNGTDDVTDELGQRLARLLLSWRVSLKQKGYEWPWCEMSFGTSAEAFRLNIRPYGVMDEEGSYDHRVALVDELHLSDELAKAEAFLIAVPEHDKQFHLKQKLAKLDAKREELQAKINQGDPNGSE